VETRTDFIELGDGTRLDPCTGKRVREEFTSVEVPTQTEAQRLVVNARKKVADLPALPDSMTPIAVVLAYSLFGLDDDEIAIATKLSVKQIINIKMQPAYETMFENVVQQVMHAETDNVRNMFIQNSKKAAKRLMQLAEDSDSAMVSLMAVKDVLDRAGHRPADIVVENRQKTENELRIVFVKKDDSPQVPVIDITPTQGGQDGV
jgi:hypothetical protein